MEFVTLFQQSVYSFHVCRKRASLARARVQCFWIFAFTSSPDGGMWLYMSWLSVKVKAIFLHLFRACFLVSGWELDI